MTKSQLACAANTQSSARPVPNLRASSSDEFSAAREAAPLGSGSWSLTIQPQMRTCQEARSGKCHSPGHRGSATPYS